MLDKASLQGMIEEKWSERAKGYSEMIHEELKGPIKDIWLREIEALVDFGPIKEPRVLDLGTGPGFFAIILAQKGYAVSAIDCAPEMLKVAQANAEIYGLRPEFFLMDHHRLDFPDDYFDLLLCRNVTWTLYDPVAAYTEWLRVLRPGGNLLIFDANWFNYLFDQGALERKRLAEKEAWERFKLKPFEESKPEQAQIMYSSLPMGQYDRPEWDLALLTKLGYLDIKIDTSLSQRVLPEAQRVQYSDTPMFAIRAKKPT
jgi:SAM-dependent methyltransferase